MGEGQAVEDAIRAWEVARVVEEEARGAVFKAQATLALVRRSLDTAGTREEEARLEAVRLMARGVAEGRRVPLEGSVGWVVDGRFYVQVGDDAIHSMGIANDPR